jgi:hypothetical protein
MANLNPLGSEKLTGVDKISRILEIARYKESTPSNINETSKSEYKLTLADGNEYQIIREKSGYVIKKTISESNVDYISPMQDRKYYSSYSQALKRLNLMAKEMNELFENKEGVSLFSEQKKFVLKTTNLEKKNPEPTDEVENVPPPPAPPMGGEPTPPPVPPSDEEESEMPSEEGDMEVPEDEMGSNEERDEVVTFKTIQKLTGKLGQKLRALKSNEEEQMSSKDVKYVINSILSALDLNLLDEDDREDVMNKLEGTEEEFNPEETFGSEEESPSEEDETSSEEGEMSPEMEPKESELGEGTWPELGDEIAKRTALKATTARFGESEDDDMTHLGNIADSVFKESKIEDVLLKYFIVSEDEKKFNQKINQERENKRKIKKSEIFSEIKRLSESIQQEVNAKKFFKENINSRFVGKTNKKNLVFEVGNKQYKISPFGSIL